MHIFNKCEYSIIIIIIILSIIVAVVFLALVHISFRCLYGRVCVCEHVFMTSWVINVVTFDAFNIQYICARCTYVPPMRCLCMYIETQLKNVCEVNQKKKKKTMKERKKKKKNMSRDTATYGEKPRFDFCVNQVENQTGVHFIKIYRRVDHDAQHDFSHRLLFHWRRMMMMMNETKRHKKKRNVSRIHLVDTVRALIPRDMYYIYIGIYSAFLWLITSRTFDTNQQMKREKKTSGA